MDDILKHQSEAWGAIVEEHNGWLHVMDTNEKFVSPSTMNAGDIVLFNVAHIHRAPQKVHCA